jgi:hypothetical protein
MTCPCHNCLVYIRCQHRIKKYIFNKKIVYYTFGDLIYECGELRKFFGLNTLQHRVKIKALSRNYTLSALTSYIEDLPHGKKLMEEFLRVMHMEELPNSLNPKIRVKK